MLARGRAGVRGGDARGGAVITCPKCNKENQDHYKFCLGCGAELPREASPKKYSGTPPQGIPAQRGAQIVDESTSVGISATPVPARPSPAPAAFSAPATPAPVLAPIASSAAPAAPPMTCPECGHANPSANRFCASCGAKLAKPASLPAPAPAAAAPAP